MKPRLVALLGAALLAAAPAVSETLEIPGLSAPATVHTDTLGVPHIVAETLEDAVRVQGWVHARDRFFQMDVSRRTAEGTLAELTGGVLDLGSDFFLRPLDLWAAAERSIAQLGDEERALYQGYADGVNAWRAGHALPPEYAELEVSQVRPWSVSDSFLVAELLGVVLSLQIDTDLSDWFDSWIAAGEAAVPPFDGEVLLYEDMVPFAPLEPVATLPDAGGDLPIAPLEVPLAAARPTARSGGASPIGLELARRYRDRMGQVPLAARALDPRARPAGSNAWAVSAAESASGAPIVANDGHLEFVIPSVGYENHLLVASDPVAGSLDLSGVSIPGIYLIVVGQSDRVAWGATNTQWDHADVFEDRLVRGDPGCPAQLCIDSAGELHAVEVTVELFRRNAVGNGTLDDLEDSGSLTVPRVPFRSFGPVLEVEDPGLVADPAGAPGETTALTLQFAALHGTREAEALLGFARAADIFEFREAVELFDFPSQNWVVADVDGNLAYFASGEAPLRADLEAGVVLSPPEIVRDGSGPGNWVPDPARAQGQQIPFAVVPDDERPQVVNPPNGFVVTANYDPVGVMADNDPFNSGRASKPEAIYYLSGYFSFALRAARITRLLRAKIDAAEPISIDDMKAFQGNTQMLDAELVVPFLLTAHANAQGGGVPPELAALGADVDIAEAVGRLAAWDFSAPTGIPEGWDAADVDGVLGAVSPEEAASSVAATLYNIWRGRVLENTSGALAERIDPTLQPFIGFGALRGVHKLLAQAPFTGVGVSGIDFFPEPVGLAPAERRDVVLLQSLREALDALASNAFAAAFANSTSQDDYRWGRLNRLTLPHPLGGDRSVPPAGGFADLGDSLPGISRDGAPETVNPTFGPAQGASTEAFRITGGSAWRRVMSPGHPDGPPGGVIGFSSMPGGASGDADDPLYASRLPVWLTVDHDEVLVSEAAVVGFPSEDVVAAEVSKAQQGCIQELNKRGAAVGKSQGKEASSCVKLAAKGKEADPQACLTADAKGKVGKARDKAASGEEKKCSERPLFAYGGEGAAADAGAAASLALVQDVFGNDLNAAIVTKSGDKAGAACQAELLKGAQKALETAWKEAGKAKKAALAGKKGAAPAESGSDVQDALAAVFAPSAKVEKALGKLASGGAKKCGGVADLAAIAPGVCADADAANVTGCLRGRVLCGACRSLNAMDALALPCDTLDDGDIDESCPPR